MKRTAFFSLFCLLTLTTLFSCSKDNWALADDEYVFVEYWEGKNGRVLEGELLGGVYIQFCCPTYEYIEETQELIGKLNFPINKPLKLILGKGHYAIGAVGNSVSSRLFGFNDFPTEQTNDLVVEKVEEGGVVSLSVNGYSSFTLMPNQNKNVIHSIDTVVFYPYWGEVIVEVTTRHIFTNHGILSKGDIIPQPY